MIRGESLNHRVVLNNPVELCYTHIHGAVNSGSLGNGPIGQALLLLGRILSSEDQVPLAKRVGWE